MTWRDPPRDAPRRNGELVFDAPWESRAFGLAAAYLQARGEGWDRFRRHLVAAIASQPPETPYYEAWTAALEALLAEDGVADAEGVADLAGGSPGRSPLTPGDQLAAP